MELSTIFAITNAGANVIGSQLGKGSIKKAAKYQKQIADMTYEFNKKQLEKQYENQYTNLFTKYAYDKLAIADNRTDVQSQINVAMSQQGVNLDSSSIEEDMNAKLDAEFTANMQNLSANVINQASAVIENKAMMEYKIGQLHDDQIYTVDQAANAAIDKATANAFASVTTAFKDISSGDLYELSQFFSNFNFGGTNESVKQGRASKTARTSRLYK